MSRFGSNNPNWKGGKSKTEHGYILVRVGKKHHLADVRGYAYEHRLNAEKNLGRRLKPKEEVHHDNRNKADNRRSNLKVKANRGHHAVEHRKTTKRLRNPGERNPLVACACGCAEKFKRFDDEGRFRRYIPGHNDHPRPTIDAILAALDAKGVALQSLIKKCNRPKQAVKVALSKLKRAGLARNLERGVWAR